MPIYEYQCSACGQKGEHLKKISDATVEKCPKCGQNTYHRLISASNLQFKGSGFYETDFKDKPKPPPCVSGEGSCNSCSAHSA